MLFHQSVDLKGMLAINLERTGDRDHLKVNLAHDTSPAMEGEFFCGKLNKSINQ